MTDPTPSEILAQMLAEAPDDAEGVWRVRIPSSASTAFPVAVEMARQALTHAQDASTGSGREMQALSQLLTEILIRHEYGRCTCVDRHSSDPICAYAHQFAIAITAV